MTADSRKLYKSEDYLSQLSNMKATLQVPKKEPQLASKEAVQTDEVQKRKEKLALLLEKQSKLNMQKNGDDGCLNELMLNSVNQHGFCALIRHGERADNIDDSLRNELGIEVEDMNDPPLTPLGFEQARDSAIYLKEFLEKNEYTRVVI